MINSTVEMAFNTAFTCGRTVAVDIISTPEQLLLLIYGPFRATLAIKLKYMKRDMAPTQNPKIARRFPLFGVPFMFFVPITELQPV